MRQAQAHSAGVNKPNTYPHSAINKFGAVYRNEEPLHKTLQNTPCHTELYFTLHVSPRSLQDDTCEGACLP